ncbi:MAG: transposase, partial [Spirochaetaceae bacterium]|nr:transposase [Spirochaetaceae bacterium]
MQQQCATKQLGFQGLGNRKVVGQFDGGTLTSDAGGLLLSELDLRCRILDSFAECFTDCRHESYLEHSVRQM